MKGLPVLCSRLILILTHTCSYESLGVLSSQELHSQQDVKLEQFANIVRSEGEVSACLSPCNAGLCILR